MLGMSYAEQGLCNYADLTKIRGSGGLNPLKPLLKSGCWDFEDHVVDERAKKKKTSLLYIVFRKYKYFTYFEKNSTASQDNRMEKSAHNNLKRS